MDKAKKNNMVFFCCVWGKKGEIPAWGIGLSWSWNFRFCNCIFFFVWFFVLFFICWSHSLIIYKIIVNRGWVGSSSGVDWNYKVRVCTYINIQICTPHVQIWIFLKSSKCWDFIEIWICTFSQIFWENVQISIVSYKRTANVHVFPSFLGKRADSDFLL
jgi:hypothetical protein